MPGEENKARRYPGFTVEQHQQDEAARQKIQEQAELGSDQGGVQVEEGQVAGKSKRTPRQRIFASDGQVLDDQSLPMTRKQRRERFNRKKNKQKKEE